MFIGDLQTAWSINQLGRTHVNLSAPLGFVDSRGRFWAAPEGFGSDGASFPWWLRYVPSIVALLYAAFSGFYVGAVALGLFLQFFTGAAFNGDYLRAAILHDAAYTYQNRSRFDADEMFYEAMIEDGTNGYRAFVMWAAVRAFGWIVWRRKRDAGA